MGLVSTIHATIVDKFARHFPVGRRRVLLLLIICVVQFILALSLCTNVSRRYLPLENCPRSTIEAPPTAFRTETLI